MAKVLVAYYSRTGTTRTIALELAARLGADVEEIRDTTTKRTGLIGYYRCAREALRRLPAPIEKPTADPAGYDLVILGTPVWASHMSSPVRSYVQAQAAKLGRVAMYCTQGGNGGPKVLEEMAELAGKRPLATLVLTQSDVLKKRYAQRLDTFVAALVSEVNRRVAVAR